MKSLLANFPRPDGGKMFRKPAIWILFILFSIGAAVFSFQYFPKVFPIVELDLKMDRKSALDSARLIAQKHNLLEQEIGLRVKNQSNCFWIVRQTEI